MSFVQDTVAVRWRNRQRVNHTAQTAAEREFSALAYGGPNIGDDIQTLAALRFMPEVAYFIYREAPFAASNAPKSFLIANGWYLHWVNRFITPPNIYPFYTSIHIRSPLILTRAVIRHLKKYEPIGCRDVPTQQLLQSRGIDAYFSGCLTLTLKKPPDGSQNGGGVIVSDLQNEFHSLVPSELMSQATLMTHSTDIGISSPLSAGYRKSFRDRLVQIGDLAMQQILPNRYSHWKRHSPLPTLDVRPDEDVVKARHRVAERMLENFAHARVVITSRLHCALPCLAFGTPVVMLHRNPGDPRFKGIDRYLRIYGPDTAPQDIEWNPAPANISDIAVPLSELVQEAVRIQRNPLP